MIDIQGSKIESRFAIESVGVTALPYPLTFCDQPGLDSQRQTASWELSASLSRQERGTHMSRFIANLDPFVQETQSARDFIGLAENIRQQLKTETTSVTARFPWNRRVKAPVTGLEGYMTYPVSITGRVGSDAAHLTLGIEIPATALCPCSKAISDRGAHNQRTTICLQLSVNPDRNIPTFESIISLAEECASARLYPILKREDEKFVTENAYDNPAFVEDLIRSVAERLVAVEAIQHFEVRVTNQESIHQHDCFAQLRWTRK